MTTLHRSKNTMFWRADTLLKTLSRDKRWIDFHRACGRCGLFFDDIDPLDDDPRKDVTERTRRSGYQAIAFRASQDRGGFYCQVFVSRGTGPDPVAAVVDAYRIAVANGDAVQPRLESIFDGAGYPQPSAPPPATMVDPGMAPSAPPPATVDVMDLIG